MSNKAIMFFEKNNLAKRIMSMNESTASALEAAQALGVELNQIAKSLTFRTNDKAVLIVMAGDAKVDSKKFRDTFNVKSKMLDLDEATRLTGYPIGGVCPFALAEDQITVYLDESLKRSEIVYPGCGDDVTLVKLSLKELEELANAKGWINIGKGWQIGE